MVGQRIGNYEIVQKLGEGGMATVYLANHPELGRRVAVKVMNPELSHSGEMVQRFFNEARAASGIGHRGIVEVSDLGTLPSGAPYIVMELLEGESLGERLNRLGRLPLQAAAEIADQASGVMAAAHGRGIVHRDLKPENLYLVTDPLLPGRELVKVLDFGIAKLTQQVPLPGRELRTRTGAILGTPRYMSPEQCRDSRDVDHRADIYSLGVVLYEMLAGAPPFVSSSWGELAYMHLGVTPPSLTEQAPEVPAKVAAVVHRALEKDPHARFPSMAEFAEALRVAMLGRTAVWTPASAGQARDPGALDGPRSSPAVTPLRTPVTSPVPGSTVLLQPAREPERRPRPTTLEAAASEVVRVPSKRRHLLPVAIAGAFGVAAAILVIAVVLPRNGSGLPEEPGVAAPAVAPVEGLPPPTSLREVLPAPAAVVTPPAGESPTPPAGEPAPAAASPAPSPSDRPDAGSTATDTAVRRQSPPSPRSTRRVAAPALRETKPATAKPAATRPNLAKPQPAKPGAAKPAGREPLKI